MEKKKDFWDKASDFLESHWSSYAEVCQNERREKEKANKEMNDRLRKSALDPNKHRTNEDGERISLVQSIQKRIKILKSTKKKV